MDFPQRPQPGIDFFDDLNAAGNMLKVDVTTATVASGETPVVFDWDYLNAAHQADNKNWKCSFSISPDQPRRHPHARPHSPPRPSV